MKQRKIIHVDMDCFYAAVEEKYNDELKGYPVGIGGPPNTRSVLCTANYEARKFGVRAAMPSAQALKLCPKLILLPPDFGLYKKESQKVHEIISRFSERVEPLSLDEAYMDVSDSRHFGGSATLIAQEIRRLIKTERGLNASAGVASNKFLAKIASDWKKPNGQFVIRPEQVLSFVTPLPVENIYGVGKVTAEKMHRLHLHTCRDIQNSPLDFLEQHFHSRAEELHRLSFGIDSREVETHWERKSLTVEETYSKDLRSVEECLNQVPDLFADWKKRMNQSQLNGRVRGIVVKMKFFDFQSTTHECLSRTPPQIEDFVRLLKNAWQRRGAPVRLLGLGARLAASTDFGNLAEQLSFAF